MICLKMSENVCNRCPKFIECYRSTHTNTIPEELLQVYEAGYEEGILHASKYDVTPQAGKQYAEAAVDILTTVREMLYSKPVYEVAEEVNKMLAAWRNAREGN